jgi:hypothetical protein
MVIDCCGKSADHCQGQAGTDLKMLPWSLFICNRSKAASKKGRKPAKFMLSECL